MSLFPEGCGVPSRRVLTVYFNYLNPHDLPHLFPLPSQRDWFNSVRRAVREAPRNSVYVISLPLHRSPTPTLSSSSPSPRSFAFPPLFARTDFPQDSADIPWVRSTCTDHPTHSHPSSLSPISFDRPHMDNVTIGGGHLSLTSPI